MSDDRNMYRQRLKEYSIQNSVNQVKDIREVENIVEYEEDEYISESVIEKIRDFISYNKKYIFIIISILIIILVISLLIYKEKNKNEGWDNLIDYISNEYDGKLEKKSGDYRIEFEVINKKTINVSCNYTYINLDSEELLMYVNNLTYKLIKNKKECEIHGFFITGEDGINKDISANLKTSSYMLHDKIDWSISIPSGLSRKNNEIIDSYISDMCNIQFESTIEVLKNILHDSGRNITMNDIGFYLY